MAEEYLQRGVRRVDIVLAYTFLRVIVGVNYFNHGATRIGNLSGFMDSMGAAMADAWMPAALVRINAALVPPVELIVGALLIVGLVTRGALIACLALMVMLMYGVTIVQNWDTAASQLIYDIILVALLAGLGFNQISLDRQIFGKGQEKSQSPDR